MFLNANAQHIDTSKVLDKELFQLVHAEYRKARSMRRWDRSYTLYNDCKDLHVALQLMIAGRTLGSSERVMREILSCFHKKGRHKVDTIARRYFATDYSTCEQDSFVKRHLRMAIEKGLVEKGEHGRTYETVYLLMTPERKAEKAKQAAELKAYREKQAAAKNRMKSARLALSALGVEVQSGGTRTVTLNVAELEKLIAMASDNASKKGAA